MSNTEQIAIQALEYYKKHLYKLHEYIKVVECDKAIAEIGSHIDRESHEETTEGSTNNFGFGQQIQIHLRKD